jgi:hypothetical protein
LEAVGGEENVHRDGGNEFEFLMGRVTCHRKIIMVKPFNGQTDYNGIDNARPPYIQSLASLITPRQSRWILLNLYHYMDSTSLLTEYPKKQVEFFSLYISYSNCYIDS